MAVMVVMVVVEVVVMMVVQHNLAKHYLSPCQIRCLLTLMKLEF